MTQSKFEEASYRKQYRQFDDYVAGDNKTDFADAWFAIDTIHAVTNSQRNQIVDPIVDTQSESTWLTVGDGFFGSNAAYLKARGLSVVATDLSDTLLKEGAEMGHIDNYKQENAENLSYADSTFDYVLCREAYNHCPRPAIALYEMLRVAHKAVVLLEPADQYICTTLMQQVVRTGARWLNQLKLSKRIWGKNIQKNTYNPVGNYVYKISKREIEKVALGLNYPHIAFKNVNVYTEKEQLKIKIGEKTARRRRFLRTTLLYEIFTRMGLMQPNLLAAIIFKTEPEQDTQAALKKSGYQLIKLPRNPYISDYEQ